MSDWEECTAAAAEGGLAMNETNTTTTTQADNGELFPWGRPALLFSPSLLQAGLDSPAPHSLLAEEKKKAAAGPVKVPPYQRLIRHATWAATFYVIVPLTCLMLKCCNVPHQKVKVIFFKMMLVKGAYDYLLENEMRLATARALRRPARTAGRRHERGARERDTRERDARRAPSRVPRVLLEIHRRRAAV